MKYGLLAGNASINDAIYRCFDRISERDRRAFVRRLREQVGDADQVMHTFRELLLGGFLASSGYAVKYGQEIRGKTPDWVLLSPSGDLAGIVELVNLHAPRNMERAVDERRKAGRVWVGRVPPVVPRLYDRLQEKASAYGALADIENVPYVIAVFGEFIANVELDDVRDCVLGEQTGLFVVYPVVSGVVFFEERAGRYPFHFVQSPHATRAIGLPSGVTW